MLPVRKPLARRTLLTRISHRRLLTMWRTHPCLLLRRHSCRRFAQTFCQRGEQASRRPARVRTPEVSTRQAGVPAPRRLGSLNHPAPLPNCTRAVRAKVLLYR
jgi:hypothetical protein